jgi:hypothetical protein
VQTFNRWTSSGHASNLITGKIRALLIERDGRSDQDLTVSIYGSESRGALVRNQCGHLVRLGLIERRARPDGRMGNFLRR